MEKVYSELSISLVLWQILVLIIQISIVYLLYKLIIRIYKKEKKLK